MFLPCGQLILSASNTCDVHFGHGLSAAARGTNGFCTWPIKLASVMFVHTVRKQGWPKPYIFTPYVAVYLEDFIHAHVCVVLANLV